MARPTTKAELLTAAAERYDALTALIAGMTEAEREADLFYGDGFEKPEAHWERDRTLRDVLVHLTAWHGLLIDWVEANERGETKPFLPAPYTWRDYAGMNVSFRDAHADTTTDAAREELANSHRAVAELMERFSDEELFVKKYFPWTGTTSLGSYCVSATSSHYDWAAKKLRAAVKAARASN